jgi:uncharacterized protein
VSWPEIVLLLATGVTAGAINAVVGSGSLVTFPTLVALGYPPVLANVTNNIGVLPGSVSAAVAYRRELAGHWRKLLPLAGCSAVGGAIGAVLLLILPASTFDAVVPVLILLACALVIVGPGMKKAINRRRQVRAIPVKVGEVASQGAEPATIATRTGTDSKETRRLVATVGLTGIYGGYFGAAQGVILLSMLMLVARGGVQRANAYKNVFAATANTSAAVVFVFTTQVAWLAALVVAIGATLGGQIGGRLGHVIPEIVYRIIIVIIGIAAVIYFYAN